MFDLTQAIAEIHACESGEALENTFQIYVGKKGKLTEAFGELKNASPEQKKELGQQLGEAKVQLTAAYEEKKAGFEQERINKLLENDLVDITVPGHDFGYHTSDTGHQTLLTQTRREMEAICQELGFIVEYGHEVVTKYENFEAVNIPLTHPATDMHDTFYLNQQDLRNENIVLRTHTSSMQNGIIQKYGVPLKAVIPAKVYRYENMDASHDTMFYQLEGMYIDKDVHVGHFKNMITTLLSAIFKMDVTIRMRPGYFPFVEPGFEIDATCPICTGKGCRLCKHTGRIEIMGAGMIHPNVLTEANVDPKKYSGFAFGIGINRVVAIKHSIHDIRLFTNGDLRFIQSF